MILARTVGGRMDRTTDQPLLAHWPTDYCIACRLACLLLPQLASRLALNGTREVGGHVKHGDPRITC